MIKRAVKYFKLRKQITEITKKIDKIDNSESYKYTRHLDYFKDQTIQLKRTRSYLQMEQSRCLKIMR